MRGTINYSVEQNYHLLFVAASNFKDTDWTKMREHLLRLFKVRIEELPIEFCSFCVVGNHNRQRVHTVEEVCELVNKAAGLVCTVIISMTEDKGSYCMTALIEKDSDAETNKA